jgi:hypothetical protein
MESAAAVRKKSILLIANYVLVNIGWGFNVVQKLRQAQ